MPLKRSCSVFPVRFNADTDASYVKPINNINNNSNKLCGRPPQYAPAPASWRLTFWPWKWCPSHLWPLMSILVFLGLSVLDFGPMYGTDRKTDVRQTDVRRASSLNVPYCILYTYKSNISKTVRFRDKVTKDNSSSFVDTNSVKAHDLCMYSYLFLVIPLC